MIHRLGQRLETRIFAGPGFDFTGENNGRRRRSANNGGERSLQRSDFEVFVQRPRENNISATVISGDHTKDHGAFEVHH